MTESVPPCPRCHATDESPGESTNQFDRQKFWREGAGPYVGVKHLGVCEVTGEQEYICMECGQTFTAKGKLALFDGDRS